MWLDLKRYLERQMGVPSAAPGEDTQWAWRLQLGWPDWLVVVFVLLAVGYVAAIYLREGAASRPVKLSLAAVRLLVVGLLLLMLGELELAVQRSGLPYLVVCVDDSESQGVRDALVDPSATGDSSAAPPRYEQVVSWLSADNAARLVELTKKFKLRFYLTGASLRKVGEDAVDEAGVRAVLEELKSRKPTEPESQLGSNLRKLVNELRGAPPAAVILTTDGVTTQGETIRQASSVVSRKQTPLFTVGVGDPMPPRDIELSDLLVDDTVFIGDDVTFEAKLTGRGLIGKETTVSLKGEGINLPVTQTLRMDADGRSQRVRLTFKPDREKKQKTGAFVFTLEAPNVDREINRDNNKLERPITFVDEKIRVLLVDAAPRYEARFLKELLDRQTTMDVRVLLVDADPEHVQQDRSAIGFFPTNPEDLANFDVVVLGDVRPGYFTQSQIELIKEFVKKGGGLFVVAGPRSCPQSFRDTPLEELLPVKLGPTPDASTERNSVGFHPKLTADGSSTNMLRFDVDEEENNKVWLGLPPIYWFAQVDEAKPGAQVLLEHPTQTRDGKPLPLLAVQYYGAGRTIFQAFDGVWRWRTVAQDLYHARYWIQSLRFLSRAKLLGKNRIAELSVDRVRVRRGEPIRLRVQFLDEAKAPRGDEPVVATVEKVGEPNRSTVTLRRGSDRRDVFEGLFSQTRDGDYLARLSAVGGDAVNQIVRFRVLPPPGELDIVRLDEEELKDAAAQTGGRYFPIAEAARLFDDGVLPFGKRVPVDNDPPIALWRTWPMLMLFAALLLTEWLLRKRYRMV